MSATLRSCTYFYGEKNMAATRLIALHMNKGRTLALVNKMWLQLGIFALLFVSGVVIMLLSVHILFWIEEVRRLMN